MDSPLNMDPGIGPNAPASKRGRYFEHLELSQRAARTVAFACAGVMTGGAGVAGLFLLWTQTAAGPVSATNWRANASSKVAAAPQAATQPAAVEELRRR